MGMDYDTLEIEGIDLKLKIMPMCNYPITLQAQQLASS